MDKLRVFEWNIHFMTKKVDKVHDLLLTQIMENEEEIVILVEYKENKNFETALMNNGYKVFTTGPLEKQNEALIAIKSNVIHEGTEPVVLTKLPTEGDEICPNLLQLDFNEGSGNQISVIGIRLKFGKGVPYDKQLKPLNRHLLSLQKDNPNSAMIVIGDFNAKAQYVEKNLNNNFNVITPKHDKKLYFTREYINNYSYFFTDKNTKIITGMAAIDHIVCSQNVKIKNAEYCWDFIKSCGVYGDSENIKKNETKWSIPAGFPDHAILRAELEINSREATNI